jgi:hypothetical protein
MSGIERAAQPASPDDGVYPGPGAPAASVNSVVRAMSIMYVRCESVLGHFFKIVLIGCYAVG